MLDLQAINNENVSLILELKNKRSIMNKDLKLNQVYVISKKGMRTNEALKMVMDVIKRGIYLLRRTNKSSNIPLNSLSNHLKDKTRSKENRAKRCVYRKKRCWSDYLNFSCVRMWIVHKLVTTKDEGRKSHTNKGYITPRWDTMRKLVILVQA
jgi:hypothetical protein